MADTCERLFRTQFNNMEARWLRTDAVKFEFIGKPALLTKYPNAPINSYAGVLHR